MLCHTALNTDLTVKKRNKAVQFLVKDPPPGFDHLCYFFVVSYCFFFCLWFAQFLFLISFSVLLLRSRWNSFFSCPENFPSCRKIQGKREWLKFYVLRTFLLKQPKEVWLYIFTIWCQKVSEFHTSKIVIEGPNLSQPFDFDNVIMSRLKSREPVNKREFGERWCYCLLCTRQGNSLNQQTNGNVNRGSPLALCRLAFQTSIFSGSRRLTGKWDESSSAVTLWD